MADSGKFARLVCLEGDSLAGENPFQRFSVIGLTDNIVYVPIIEAGPLKTSDKVSPLLITLLIQGRSDAVCAVRGPLRGVESFGNCTVFWVEFGGSCLGREFGVLFAWTGGREVGKHSDSESSCNSDCRQQGLARQL